MNPQLPCQSNTMNLSPETASESVSRHNDHWKERNSTKTDEPSELREYNLLIQKMLQEIDSCESKLENSRYSRIKNGVLNIHGSEILRFQLEHGHPVLRSFDHSHFTYVSLS
jgi:hypothetical protein